MDTDPLLFKATGWVLWQFASKLKGIPDGSDRLRRHLLRLERAGTLPEGVMKRFTGKIWVNLEALELLIAKGDPKKKRSGNEKNDWFLKG